MKKINEQADLSSSEDETSTSILREAIDEQFLNNDLYSIKKTQAIFSSGTQINQLDKNSLKISSKEDRFGVTHTFQNFIGKKLDEILEKTIQLENSESINCDEQKRRRSKSLGIKLLNTSRKSLTVVKIKEDCTEFNKRSKKNKQIAEDKEDKIKKFREAAVDPECILSKLETKAWVNKRPEPEFKYKRLNNGTLIEM